VSDHVVHDLQVIDLAGLIDRLVCGCGIDQTDLVGLGHDDLRPGLCSSVLSEDGSGIQSGVSTVGLAFMPGSHPRQTSVLQRFPCSQMKLTKELPTQPVTTLTRLTWLDIGPRLAKLEGHKPKAKSNDRLTTSKRICWAVGSSTRSNSSTNRTGGG